MSDETDHWYYWRLRRGVASAARPEDVYVLPHSSWDAAEADGVAHMMPEPGDGSAWGMCEFYDEPQLREFFALDRTDLEPDERLHRESVVAAILAATRGN